MNTHYKCLKIVHVFVTYSLLWSIEHLKVRDRIMNTSRYLRSFTHDNATPVVVNTEAHATSLLGSIRKQHDFLVLITISSKSNSH